MAKLPRVLAKIFAFNAPAADGGVGVFGSFAAGSAAFTTNPLTAQSLSNWLDGWSAAIVGNDSPAVEDFNAVCFVLAYQIAYLMQAGVPEYDATTTYYTGSLVMDGGSLYYSLVDTNLGNSTSDTTKWVLFFQETVVSKTTTYTAVAGQVVVCDATSAAFTVNLPAAASNTNKKITVKKKDSTANNVTIDANGSETIDGALTHVLTDQYEGVTMISDGTTWWII